MTVEGRVGVDAYRVMVSTTSRLVGEYEGSDVQLTLAFPDSESMNLRLTETPMSRSAVIVLFDMETPETQPRILPLESAEHVGQRVCDVLSVFYGKRFDCHGLTEGAGIFWVPDLSLFSRASHPRLPFNSHSARTAWPVPLDLAQAARVEKWFAPPMDDVNTRRVETACAFYARALRNAEHDSEVAYLHLITAGEVLAGLNDYGSQELLDDQTLKDVAQVREHLGEKMANRFTGRMTSIRMKFVKSLLTLLEEDFYADGQADETNDKAFLAEGMKDLEGKEYDMAKCLASAYDVRSRYVHSGTPFEFPVATTSRFGLSDRTLGRPSLADRDFAKTLEKSPTLCGLERVLRYCLLKRMGVSASSPETTG
ncbi:MAG: hypothetical protein F4X40_05185 [Chloroflexi bacterium]|nr:hypothetical protein [Chloroflexota bacterium]